MLLCECVRVRGYYCKEEILNYCPINALDLSDKEYIIVNPPFLEFFFNKEQNVTIIH